MEYILGAAAGILYGGSVGLLKYIFLWKKMTDDACDAITTKMVYIRLIISYVANVAALLSTYFVRNIIPFDFAAFAIGTAVALSLAGKIFSIQKALQKVEP